MVDLRTSLGGLQLSNPFFVASLAPVASLTPDEHADNLARYVKCGAAAVATSYTTATRQRPADSRPRGRSMRAESKPPFGTEGFFLVAKTYDVISYLDETLATVERLKTLVDVPIIANIVGPGADADGWAQHAKVFERAGCAMIEMNISCPVVEIPSDFCWMKDLPTEACVMLGQLPEEAKAVTKAVVNAVGIPVFVKMTPEVGYPMLIAMAQKIREAGAAGVTVINAPISIAPPDIYNDGKPRFQALDAWSFGGTYGPWDRFLAYKFITAIAQNVPELDISAVGGNVDPEHSVEFLMLGAQNVQLSSAVMWHGPRVVRENLRFLEKYMADRRYETIDDFRAAALKYIVPLGDVDYGTGHCVVDEELCTGCDKCTQILCNAISVDDSMAHVVLDKCSGCGFCVMVCPENALSVAL